MDEIVITAPWRDDFVVVREDARGDFARVRARVRGGELIRLARGVYYPATRWESASKRDRHLALAAAVTLLRGRRLVLSHRSAAVAWGLPLLDDIPHDVHVVADRAGGGRSDDRLVRHCLDVPAETEFVGGFEVTLLARTAVDIARTSRFVEGVMVADAVLARGVTSEQLRAELPPPRHRGVKLARDVIHFADARTESPLESMSRVSVLEAGLTAPELQHVFRDQQGRIRVDFWWPRFGIVGEADGRAKYIEERYREGRSLDDVMLDEKARELRLLQHPHVRAIARWDAATAVSPARLGRLLRTFGVS